VNTTTPEITLEPAHHAENAERELFSALYDELKLRAHSLRKSHSSLTLDTTAIVHETFLKLAEGKHRSVDRTHLVRTAALAMRQILLDHLRAMQSEKRAGPANRVTLTDLDLQGEDAPDRLLQVIDAMDRLREIDARLADTFSLRVFAGLSLEEIGQTLGVSHMTCSRDFQTARAYLLSLVAA
jgi:RNA polymerase sigma factor (TIGR02999 family)